MNLKCFFLSLASHKQEVEIYFNEENRDSDFGFKINGIDSKDFYLKNKLFEQIESEIRDAFLGSELIDDGEGDTSYFIQPDLTCIKKAKYFSCVSETEKFCIENNETIFYFKNTDILKLCNITITKGIDSFNVDNEKEIKKFLKKHEYQEFYKFYDELLNEFQEMEIYLQLDEHDENTTDCSIISMYGSYQKKVDFNILDSSFEISKSNLNGFLTEYFNIDVSMASKILV